jgi:lysylphosphatidylglycerol synthetase-like protein (DUF2156 family)
VTNKQIHESIKKYGSTCLAFSCTQEDLNYFCIEDGFIAYKRVKIFNKFTQIAVLGDPICSEEKKFFLLKEFIRTYKNIFFVQITTNTKKHLENLKYKIHPFGPEFYINLNSYKISWKKKQIKKSINWQKKNKLKIQEQLNCDPAYWEKFYSLQKKWKSKKKHVLTTHGFLNRPLLKKESDVRFFHIENNNQLISFLRCDPLYKNSKIFGYAISYIMYNPIIKKNLTYGIIDQLISLLKKEKEIIYIALGVAPYKNIYPPQPNLYLSVFQKCLYHLGSYFYNFNNLNKFKSNLATKSTPTFFASKDFFPIKNILSTYCITIGLSPKNH